ncbi:MAG: ABC transporter ATP-binding protein [Planctomycetota bacterium]|nr:ABC transporter ATP-binding protein [Planctomycetota bacterium]
MSELDTTAALQETPTRRRITRNLRDVLRYAKPHLKLVIVSILLMMLQSAANYGRLLIFIPVFTKVIEVESGKEREQIEMVEKEAAGLVVFLEDMLEASNGITESFVSESWYASRLEGLEGEEREAEAARWLDRLATMFSITLMFVLLIGVMCAATYGETYIATLAQLRILMDVREAVVRRLLLQPVSFFDGRSRGELVQRALGDVGGYGIGLGMIFSLVRTLISLGTPLILMFMLSPILMLSMLIAIPFLAPMRKLSMRTLKRAHRRQEQSGKLVQVLLQIFSGVRIVKAFGSEESRAKEFRETDEEVTRRALKVQRAKSTASALITFLNNLLMMLLLVGGGLLVLTGTLNVQPALLFAFLMMAAAMYQPFKRFVRNLNNLLDSMAAIERTTAYLEMPIGRVDPPNAKPFAGVRDAIRFENVGFAYVADQPVLHDVSFEIPRGATVALVGPSGGGKSTICDLLLGFYQPTAGRIAVDGEDLEQFKRESYLQRAAMVGQSPFLFHDTIRENIRQGRPGATDAEIEEAAQAAYIHDDILAQDGGYDAEVGEEGIRLSGGQRQRITIARALVRDPDVLVLDEATASLDTASEQAVQAALDALREGRTTLVVAHRLSTIRDADQILVVADGRIANQGTHEELIAHGGLYAELVEMQDVSSRQG